MYAFAIGGFVHQLRGRATLRRRGAAYADARHIDPDVLLDTRLYADMFPLGGQVRAVNNHALAAAANLSAQTPPEFDGVRKSLAELLAEIDTTNEALATLQPAQLQLAATRQVTLTLRRGIVTLDGSHYLWYFVVPNFFFHLTTAYDILRHRGVAVGKADFLGDLAGLRQQHAQQ